MVTPEWKHEHISKKKKKSYCTKFHFFECSKIFLKAVHHFSFFSVFEIYWVRALEVFWISGLRGVKSDPNLSLIFRMLPINSPVTCSHHESQSGYVTLLCHMYPEWSCTQVFRECSRRGVARQSGMSEMFPFHWERKLQLFWDQQLRPHGYKAWAPRLTPPYLSLVLTDLRHPPYTGKHRKICE